MRTPRVLGAALLSLSGLSSSGPARAQPAPTVDLQWTAPAGCPQQSDVRERVKKLSGTSASTHALRAEGSITQTVDGRFHLKLLVRSGGLVGERHIESSSCETLAGAAMRVDEPAESEDD